MSELAAFPSESCSIHKTVSCKLKVIIPHFTQNYLAEDSHQLKCLNGIRRQNVSLSFFGFFFLNFVFVFIIEIAHSNDNLQFN